MNISRNKLYTILLLISAAGYLWVCYNWSGNSSASGVTLCVFKSVTHLPCPSCGVTRSVSALLHHGPVAAAAINPLGIIVFMLMVIVPCWILADLIFKRNTFYRKYLIAEKYLRKPSIAFSLTGAVLLIWVSNIIKGL